MPRPPARSGHSTYGSCRTRLDGCDKATDADDSPNRPPHTNAEIMKAVAHHEPDDSDE